MIKFLQFYNSTLKHTILLPLSHIHFSSDKFDLNKYIAKFKQTSLDRHKQVKNYVDVLADQNFASESLLCTSQKLMK
jgi:hypothetical protein